MKRYFLISLLLILSMLTISTSAESNNVHKPIIPVGKEPGKSTWYSTNWAGYAVTGAANSVTDAKGSWVVPTVTCTPSGNQYSSFWTGIDGFSDNTVEQTGTDSDCSNGNPTYYAWYEFYPNPSHNILTVYPGDIMFAEVSYSGGQFTVTITDETPAHYGTFTKKAKVSSAKRSSAEWIAEAPSSLFGILPLADFGTSYFGQDYAPINSISTNYGTVGGVTGSINSFGSNVQTINMVTSSGAPRATPSQLTTDGTSFTVTWQNS